MVATLALRFIQFYHKKTWSRYVKRPKSERKFQKNVARPSNLGAKLVSMAYVSRIINGSIQAKYGKAHKIAIKLGLIDSNRSCYEVGLGIRSTDLTQMEQWFLSILFNLHKNNFGD